MPCPGRRCPRCGTSLAIHQPDPDLPDRLLGTCAGCRTWCLLDGALGLVAVLPSDRPRRRRGHPARRESRDRGG